VDAVWSVPRLLVGLFLVVAAVAKLRSDARFFLGAILALDVIPRSWAAPVSRGLPWIELVVGTALVLGVEAAWSAVAAFTLIGLLTAAILLALSNGKRVFCACLGFTAEQVAQSQWTMVWRNVLLMLACLSAAARPGAWRLDAFWPSLAHEVPPVWRASLLVVTVVFALGAAGVRIFTGASAAAGRLPPATASNEPA
jgi:hypothetical protein